MKRLVPRMLFPLAVLSLAMSVLPAAAQQDDQHHGRRDGGARLSVTVSFGAGLNSTGAANHHVLPPVIRVRQGGVVNFAVAGFHQIFVYQPGTKPENIIVPATGAFINDLTNIFYQGIAPAGGPLATPATANPANGGNRVESVGFTEPGDYLVICNVRTHFIDGMYAIVRVVAAPSQAAPQ